MGISGWLTWQTLKPSSLIRFLDLLDPITGATRGRSWLLTCVSCETREKEKQSIYSWTFNMNVMWILMWKIHWHYCIAESRGFERMLAHIFGTTREEGRGVLDLEVSSFGCSRAGLITRQDLVVWRGLYKMTRKEKVPYEKEIFTLLLLKQSVCSMMQEELLLDKRKVFGTDLHLESSMRSRMRKTNKTIIGMKSLFSISVLILWVFPPAIAELKSLAQNLTTIFEWFLWKTC